MPIAERQRQTLERLKEVEHEHRRQPRPLSRTGMGLALSLRFLRTAAHRLITPPVRREPRPVPRPAAGLMGITFVGHASVMLTTAAARVLTDPLLADFVYGLRRVEAACLDERDADEVNLILISNAHRDHLHRSSLRALPDTATVVVPPRCARAVAALGFDRVVELAPGEELRFRDLEITAVAARHPEAGGPLGWRGACGYLVAGQGVRTYFAGDTGYFSGFRAIGQRYRPDVALLPIGGYEPPPLREVHMSPRDALYAFEDLGAKLLVPIAYGSFPLGYEPMSEPLRWLRTLCAAQGLGDRLAALGHGQTCTVRGAAPAPSTGG